MFSDGLSKNWEYSQHLLSEETLPNNSCESPLFSSAPPCLSPPLVFSSSFFTFSCFGVCSLCDTMQGAVLRATVPQTHTVSVELMKGDPLDGRYRAHLRVCLPHCWASLC